MSITRYAAIFVIMYRITRLTRRQYFAPDYELDVRSSNMDNANTNEYLTKIKNDVIQNLSRTKFAPSAQMQEVPGDLPGMDDEADAELDDMDEDDNKDVRHTSRRWDKHVDRDGELSESEDEAENERNGVLRQPNRPKPRRNIMDFPNPNAAPEGLSNAGTPISTPRRAGSPVPGADEPEADQGTAANAKDEDIEMGESNAQGSTAAPAQAAPHNLDGAADVEMGEDGAAAQAKDGATTQQPDASEKASEAAKTDS